MGDAESVDIEISGMDDTPIHIERADKPSFSLGVDMLMNRKRAPSVARSDDDLDDLEKELSGGMDKVEIEPEVAPTAEKKGFLSSLFTGSTPKPTEDAPKKIFNLGTTKVEDRPVTETWDGYKKVNEIPVDPAMPPPVSMSKEDMVREKFKILKKLEELQQKHGVHLSKNYTMESSFLEMKGEYETVVAEKERTNSIKFQGQILKTIVDGIEFLNKTVDPFDIKLDGWGESIGENITDYNDIFAELHEKYKGRVNMSPELKLFFQLISSAITVHITNLAYSKLAPSAGDIFKQNPELARHITEATMNSMRGQGNGGVADFVSSMMNDRQAPMQRGNNNTAPREAPPPQPVQPRVVPEQSRMMPDSRSAPEQKPMRPDMKGPENIDALLAKLRGGSDRSAPPEMTAPSAPQLPQRPQPMISIQQRPPPVPQREPVVQRPPQIQQRTPQVVKRPSPKDTSSVISIEDLKSSRPNTPSKRRNRTDRNIVSLDM